MTLDEKLVHELLRNSHCTFPFPGAFLTHEDPLTIRQAMLLALYMEKHAQWKRKKTENPHIFFLTHAAIRECLGKEYTDGIIRRIKTELKKRKLIRTRMASIGSRLRREWILIRYQKIAEMLTTETPSVDGGVVCQTLPPSNTTYTTYTSCKSNTSYHSNTSDTSSTLISQGEIVQQDAALLIAWWNELPGVTKHTSPSTKTYQQAIDYLSHLLEGKPIAITKSGAPDKRFEAFCTRYAIRPSIAIKTWSVDMLKALIQSIIDQWENKTKPILPELLWVGMTSRGGGYSTLLIHANRPDVSSTFKKTANALAAALGDRIPAQKKMVWATRLAAFSVEAEIPGEDLLAAAEWYSRNNDRSQPYTILVDSADEFCQKYPQLKRAMERNMKPAVLKSQEDPQTLFAAHFGAVDGSLFYRDCFKTAMHHIGGDPGAVASRLVEFHTKLREYQKSRKTPDDGWGFKLPAVRIIQYYLDWIEENSWITTKSDNLLSMDHGIFNTWLEQHARQNMDRNPLTGEWFVRKAM